MAATVLTALVAGAVFSGETYVRWRQREVKRASLRAPLVASLAKPRFAVFRHEYVVPGSKYLCGEVNVKKAKGGYAGFRRFISYPGGYAVEGGSTKSFYAPDEKSRYLFAKLAVEISMLKRHKYTTTRAALNRAEFDGLWQSNCA